jgi:tagaturonate reductase
MKQLHPDILNQLAAQTNLHLPPPGFDRWPEKVIQFGTGVLLRGLTDYYIDRANREAVFCGRVVVVKSTSRGGADAFEQQGGLYTVCERGITGNIRKEEYWVNSSISRVLTASSQWEQVLACADNPSMKIVVSNTTEVGIVYQEESIGNRVPDSFPAKLLALLYRRYQRFSGAEGSGMVIVPTELVPNNGDRLRDIVLQLAEYNQLAPAFIVWLQKENHFCSSLVDRIVPGMPPEPEWKELCSLLGYRDELMINAEPFNLWAIQANSPEVAERLSFASVNPGMVISEDIEKFRELKLRLLNGTHSFCCGLAYLAGFDTVKEALAHENVSTFVRRLMMTEIAEVLPAELVSYNEACKFADTVLDRFRNPFLEHRWLSITLNYTGKMRMRNIPLLLRYYKKQQQVPTCMARGFAAYILFMKCTLQADGTYAGLRNGELYTIQDTDAPVFAAAWSAGTVEAAVHSILQNTELWGEDLSQLPGWEEAVLSYVNHIRQAGALAVFSSEPITQTV